MTKPRPPVFRRWMRRAAMALALVIGITVARYGSSRLLAERNAVRIYTLEAAQLSPRQFDTTLRFASFNIAHGRGTNDTTNWSDKIARRARLRQIADLLREHADIAVLNEVDFDAAWTGHENQARVIARQAGFPHVMEQRNFDVALPFYRLRFGNAVLSRFPIRSAQFVKFPPRSEWEDRLAGSKHGSYVDVQLDNQTTIRIFAVHLEWRDEATRGRSEGVLSALIQESPSPFFCIGDFNCTMHVGAREAGASETSMIDMLVKRGGVKAFHSTALTREQFTYPSWDPKIGIDWILVPPDWRFSTHDVLDVRLSDHRPVLATLRRP